MKEAWKLMCSQMIGSGKVNLHSGHRQHYTPRSQMDASLSTLPVHADTNRHPSVSVDYGCILVVGLLLGLLFMEHRRL